MADVNENEAARILLQKFETKLEDLLHTREVVLKQQDPEFVLDAGCTKLQSLILDVRAAREAFTPDDTLSVTTDSNPIGSEETDIVPESHEG